MVTNVKLTDIALRQFATRVHSSTRRGSQLDGDTLFALTTGAVELTGAAAGPGALASEVAWGAVLSSVA